MQDHLRKMREDLVNIVDPPLAQPDEDQQQQDQDAQQEQQQDQQQQQSCGDEPGQNGGGGLTWPLAVADTLQLHSIQESSSSGSLFTAVAVLDGEVC